MSFLRFFKVWLGLAAQLNAMNRKLCALLEHLSRMAPIGIAYSGGLDSRFLAFCAQKATARFTLFHIAGPHVSKEETEWAASWARLKGFPLTVVELDILKVPKVQENIRDRCYHCKLALFSALQDRANGLLLCDGTNATDLCSPRPGLRALTELKVISPLAAAGFEKTEIRECARILGLERPEQPARPCLMTRFAYGIRPEQNGLLLIGALEEEAGFVLRTLFPNNPEPPDFRIRVGVSPSAQLHVATHITIPQALVLQDALKARLTREITKKQFKSEAEKLLIMQLKALIVHASNRVSGYHDQSTVSGAA